MRTDIEHPFYITILKPKKKPRWWQVHAFELVVIGWCGLMIMLINSL